VEALSDADEGDRPLVEEVNQPREIHQGAGQPIDLVDDDAVDLASLDVIQQALQSSIGSICAHRIRSRAPLRRSATGPSAPRAVSPEPPRWPWCSSSSRLRRKAGGDLTGITNCRRSCSVPGSLMGSNSIRLSFSPKPPPEPRPPSPRFGHSSSELS